ncbi:coiled-coil domain-containing protein 172 [Cololabis saira]|uniref:coiled-coil domain-containing protein 172 n=1 Tax=Cololabis saira TaxID=129043 RepID=UPI002AD40645|nr:coiled-coil domain-containing protein 172 [Cololabis saira]
MSLDSLYHQMLLTEQHLSNQTKQFKDVKVAIIRCKEKVKGAVEKSERISAELQEKAQQLSAARLQCDLKKKCEEQTLKQIEELLCQNSHLGEHLAKIRRESKEEEENFLQEISRFNSDFSLRGNRATVFESQTQTHLLALEREVEALHKEMKLMSRRNGHMSSIEEEKRALVLELQALENKDKDVDRQLTEAQVTTQSLRSESRFVSQKHLTDSTCLRLRKELDTYKEGELEHLRDDLSSQIQFLQSKLDSSQDKEQQ